MFPEPQGDLKDRVVKREIATDTIKPARALCVRAFFIQERCQLRSSSANSNFLLLELRKMPSP
jgi:hypothetical protein